MAFFLIRTEEHFKFIYYDENCDKSEFISPNEQLLDTHSLIKITVFISFSEKTDVYIIP